MGHRLLIHGRRDAVIELDNKTDVVDSYWKKFRKELIFHENCTVWPIGALTNVRCF